LRTTEVLRDGGGDVWVFVPFTREWCVDRFFDALVSSDVPLSRCRLTVYIDSDDLSLLEAVVRRATPLPVPSLSVHYSDWASGSERVDDGRLVRLRRARHTVMRVTSIGLMPRDVSRILLLEDDTLIPPHTWQSLLAGIKMGYDWVCGFEVGRWALRKPGLWQISGMESPTILASAKPGKGIAPVDATGVYCVLSRPEVYASVPWDEYDNAFGHDTSVTYRMKLAGYHLAAAWDVECVHMTETGDLSCDRYDLVRLNRPGFHPRLFSGDYTT